MSGSAEATSSYEKKREKVKAELEQRQAAEKNALGWVMTLLEANITEKRLLEAVSQLTPQHYRDVTEERGLALSCGYPICTNKLKSLNHKQKYHISTRANKVYDVSERKYFCSASCYKASKFLEAQISEEPLWARGVVFSSSIKLLASGAEGRKSDVKDESVVIDSNSAYADADKPLTEILAEDVLNKLTLEDADSKEDAVLDAASLSEEGDSSDDEGDQPIRKLLTRRKEERLTTAPDSSTLSQRKQPIGEGEQWVGSMLTRLNTSQGQGDIPSTPTATGNHKQSSVTRKAVESSTKEPVRTADSKRTGGTTRKEHAITSKNDPVKSDIKLVKTKAAPSKVVLLDVTMPAPAAEVSHADARQTSNQMEALKVCLDRLSDWFTDGSRQLLFMSVGKESDSLSQSKPSTSTSCEAEAEEAQSVTSPNIETIISKQRSIVYQRLLKSYERRSTALPGVEGFKDKLGALTKTFRLTKDNISAKPLEWNMLSLILGACIHQQNAEVLESITAELVKVANDKDAGKTLDAFIEYHRQLVSS